MIRYFLIVFLVAAVPLFAQEASLQFNQANQLYRDGEYEKAVAMYEQIAANGYEESNLYYNLGNAYYKLKNIPAAILNYERAKRLAPHDEDVLYNLRLANIRVVDKIEPVPKLFILDWWNSFVAMFSSSIWALIAISALWAGAIACTVFRVGKSAAVQRISLGACALFVVAAIVAFTGTAQQYGHEYREPAGVIFSPTVSVKSSPDSKSTDLFVVHEGVKVEMLDTVGEWKKIRLADGKIGWMSAADLREI